LKQPQSTYSEPKLYRRLTIHSKMSRLKSPSSLSGEMLAESQDATVKKGDSLNLTASKEDIIQAKHRIQRQKAQNRKSFRLMKNQKSNDRNIIKSESIDNADELREQLNFNKLKKENSSITSPDYASVVQSLLSSSQD